MAERLLIVPVEQYEDGSVSYTYPKYGERADAVGSRAMLNGNAPFCIAVFVGPEDVLDDIASEDSVRELPDNAGMDRVIQNVSEKAAWTGPPIDGRDDLIDFLRPTVE